jgi:hypothetical protein
MTELFQAGFLLQTFGFSTIIIHMVFLMENSKWKAKLFMCLINRYTMTAYGGVEMGVTSTTGRGGQATMLALLSVGGDGGTHVPGVDPRSCSLLRCDGQ